MTNGITNVVGSQSYNCRLYSRVSLIHSQYNTIHQEVRVFLEMISIPDAVATTKCAELLVTFLSIGDSARNGGNQPIHCPGCLLYSPLYRLLTSQSFFGQLGTETRYRDYYHLVVQARNINELVHTKCSLATFCRLMLG